jgi:hypothetical protein
MKLRPFVLSIFVVLFAVSLLQAQALKPASLTIYALPNSTSPQQRIQFSNTGSSELTLTISAGGPFAIPKNDCKHPLKAFGHCYVWVTYSPTAYGTDDGMLTFAFNDQSVSVALTGEGVHLIPTSNELQLKRDGTLKTTITVVNGYKVPDGEQIQVMCTCVSGPQKGYVVYATGTLQNEVASVPSSIVDVLGGHFMWSCSSAYFGDADFELSGSQSVTVWSKR